MAQRVPYDFWGARYPNLDRLFIALWYIPIGILLRCVVDAPARCY